VGTGLLHHAVSRLQRQGNNAPEKAMKTDAVDSEKVSPAAL